MRIRTIKPEFWDSDVIQGLDIATRLLFIGLWNYVDDNGVGKDSVRKITTSLFAGDYYDNPHETSLRTHGGLSELSSAGLIVRYEVENERFLQIVNWDEHQKVNRPSKPRFPRYSADQHTLTEPSLSTHGGLTIGTGNRGTEEQGNISCATADADCAPDPKPATYSKAFEEFWRTYPLRKSKRRAYQRWQEALKRANPAEIIAGAARYRDDPNREDRYTKYPEGWLSGNGWEDDPLPQRNGPSTHTTTDRVQGWLALSQQLAQEPRKEIPA